MKVLLVALHVILIASCMSTIEPVPPQTNVQFGQIKTVLGAGDVIDVKVYGEPELTNTYQINPDGHVNLPLIGLVFIQGFSPDQAALEIANQYNTTFLKNAQVTILVKEFNSRRVFVLGEVGKPGPYPYNEKMSVIAAIAMAGGTNKTADANRTILTRDTKGEQTRFIIPVGKIGKGQSPDIPLAPGDIIFVPESIF
jgi:protein involved in polysaccharide export with SLBB domain